MIRSIWVSRLPSNIQAILASQLRQPLNDAADLADNIFAVLNTRPTIAPVAAQVQTKESNLELLVQQLTLQLAEISSEVASIKQNISEIPSENNRQRRIRFRSQSRSRERFSSSGPRPTGICWYHWKFRQNANKCTKPCSWIQENALGSH